MEQLKLDIEGMSCGGCVRSVQAALEALPGVRLKQVSVGAAEVEFDPAKTSGESVKRAIEQRGFEVRGAR